MRILKALDLRTQFSLYMRVENLIIRMFNANIFRLFNWYFFLSNMKNVTKLSEQELRSNSKTSWHDQYRNSAWIFVGGLPYDLSEGIVEN